MQTMRKSLFVIPCLATLLLATVALVDESKRPTDEDPAVLCEQALDRLMLGDEEGLDFLRQHLWAGKDAEEPDLNWELFRTQFTGLLGQSPHWGEPLGYELLEKEEYGTTFLKYKYVVKYERKYLFWTFVLVRLKGPWSLLDVTFRTDLRALFE